MTNKSRHYDLLIDSLSQLDRLNLEDLEAIGEDIDDNELVCHNDWLAKGEDDGIYGCIIQRCASIDLSSCTQEGYAYNIRFDEDPSIPCIPLWYQAIQAFDQEVLQHVNKPLIEGKIAKKLWKKCLAGVKEGTE